MSIEPQCLVFPGGLSPNGTPKLSLLRANGAIHPAILMHITQVEGRAEKNQFDTATRF